MPILWFKDLKHRHYDVFHQYSLVKQKMHTMYGEACELMWDVLGMGIVCTWVQIHCFRSLAFALSDHLYPNQLPNQLPDR